MKRNKLFLLGLFVVFAAVLSLSLVSSTFARYTSSGKAEDSARVAKWGVVVTVTGADAFGEKYDDEIEAAGTKVVSTSGNVLAPGTNGTLGSIQITGTTEVMVTITVVLDIDLGDNWKDANGHYYCPLVIGGLSGLDYNSADEFEAAIEALVTKTHSNVDANKELADVYSSVELLWSWEIETGADDDAKAANSIKDTFLGTTGLADISVKWTASVVQVD